MTRGSLPRHDPSGGRGAVLPVHGAGEYNRTRRDARLSRWRSSARWQRLRRLHLAAHPLCASCERAGRVTPATQVHHVARAATTPDLFWDPRNLESVCTTCHARETWRERREGARHA